MKAVKNVINLLNTIALFLLFVGPYVLPFYQLKVMGLHIPADLPLQINNQSIVGQGVVFDENQVLVKLDTEVDFYFELNRNIEMTSWVLPENQIFKISSPSSNVNFVVQPIGTQNIVIKATFNSPGVYQLLIIPNSFVKLISGKNIQFPDNFHTGNIAFNVVSQLAVVDNFSTSKSFVIIDPSEANRQKLRYELAFSKPVKSNLGKSSFKNIENDSPSDFEIGSIVWSNDNSRCFLDVYPSLKNKQKKKEFLHLALNSNVVFKDLQNKVVISDNLIKANKVDIINNLDYRPPSAKLIAPDKSSLVGKPIPFKLMHDGLIDLEGLRKKIFFNNLDNKNLDLSSITIASIKPKEFDIIVDAKLKGGLLLGIRNFKDTEELLCNDKVTILDYLQVFGIIPEVREVEFGQVLNYQLLFNTPVKINPEHIIPFVFNKAQAKFELVKVEQVGEKEVLVSIKVASNSGDIILALRENVKIANESNFQLTLDRDYSDKDSVRILPSLDGFLTVSNTSAGVDEFVKYDLKFNLKVKFESLKKSMFKNLDGSKLDININPFKGDFSIEARMDKAGIQNLVLLKGSRFELLDGSSVMLKKDIQANQTVEIKNKEFKGKVIIVVVDTQFLRDINNKEYLKAIDNMSRLLGGKPNHPEHIQFFSREGLRQFDEKIFQKPNDMAFTEDDFSLVLENIQKEVGLVNLKNPIKILVIWTDNKDILNFKPNFKDNGSLNLAFIGNAIDLNQKVKDFITFSRLIDQKTNYQSFPESVKLFIDRLNK